MISASQSSNDLLAGDHVGRADSGMDVAYIEFNLLINQERSEIKMSTITSITIDESGKILLPLEANQELKLHNGNCFKVSITSEHIVLAPLTNATVDQNLITALIHEGVLMDPNK